MGSAGSAESRICERLAENPARPRTAGEGPPGGPPTPRGGPVMGADGRTGGGGGSDAGGTRTTARLEDGDGGAEGGTWVIDGGKRFITNAGQAGTYIITARTGDKADGTAEISAFILPADT